MKKKDSRAARTAHVNVAVVGAAGRMGQRIIACAGAMKDVAIVAAVDMPGCPALGRDAGVQAGVAPINVPVTSDLCAACRAADVVIDFALAAGVTDRIACYTRVRKPFVLGTTGLERKELAAVERAAKVAPVLHAPNFSLGVNLLFQLVNSAAAALNDEFDVEIVEMHHRRKNDAPSGTALRLAEMVEQGRGLKPDTRRVHGRQGMVGARPSGQIGLHAVRGGDVVGEHTVMFAADGERVELVHKAGSRDAFARGALRAALFIARKAPGAYSMNNVLGLG
jgi:4-hydroxy-tetrahydrodipicolinate reductase